MEGLGTAGGFKIVVQDANDNGLRALQASAEQVVAAGQANPRLQGLFTSFRADTPWLELVIDRAQAKDRGVSIDDLRTTLESTLGPYYVNDFNRFGRTWQVNVQAQPTFRESVEDVKQLKVRNAQGDMVPLAAFATVRFASGPVLVMRYNMYPSAAVHADPGPATSSGQAIAALESTAADQLPATMRTEWTELALLQLQTGNTATWVFMTSRIIGPRPQARFRGRVARQLHEWSEAGRLFVEAQLPDGPDPGHYFRQSYSFGLADEDFGRERAEPLLAGRVAGGDSQTSWETGPEWVAHLDLQPGEVSRGPSWLTRAGLLVGLDLAGPRVMPTRVRVLDSASGALRWEFPLVPYPCVIGRDGRRVAGIDPAGAVEMWDADSTPAWAWSAGAGLAAFAGVIGFAAYHGRRAARQAAAVAKNPGTGA